jgi:hypothetical protein
MIVSSRVVHVGRKLFRSCVDEVEDPGKFLRRAAVWIVDRVEPRQQRTHEQYATPGPARARENPARVSQLQRHDYVPWTNLDILPSPGAMSPQVDATASCNLDGARIGRQTVACVDAA